jgi:hypothetical protein
MSLLEDVKRIAEKATGWKRPEDPRQLLRDRKTADLPLRGRRPYSQSSEMATRDLQERRVTTPVFRPGRRFRRAVQEKWIGRYRHG